jgi:Ni/Co efflux regulator RcnB
VFALDTTTIVGVLVIAAVVLAVAALAMFFLRRRRTSDLESRYGSEYGRAVKQRGRRKAEAELSERERRVSQYEIRSLQPPERDQFAERWTAVQAEFVDAPRTAVQHADVLLQEVMHARGYPVSDFDQRAADLSVEYGDLVAKYRSANAISQRAETAGTEDLRRAMLAYRTIFENLLKVEGTAAA